MKKKQLNRERSGGLRLLSLLLAVVMLCGLLIPGGAMVMNTYADEMEAAEVAEPTVTEDEPAEAPGESTDTPSETPAETPADPPAEEVPAEDEAPAQEETPVATPEEPEQPDQTEKPVESSDADKSEESGEPNAVDALYDRLMACETLDEINAILDNLSDEEAALMDQFTAEQEAALEEKMTDLGAYETETSATATVITVPENTIVAYAYRRNNSSEWVWSDEYTESFSLTWSTTSGDNEEFRVFFARPKENHLLTTYKIGDKKSHDLYNIDDYESSMIKDYPGLEALIREARNRKYLTLNGYRGSATGNVTLTQEFISEEPTLDISATANPSTNVKPRDLVEFTVTLTPQASDKCEQTDLDITSLTINDRVYQKDEILLTSNGDGTYTAVVTYTASEADWLTGEIRLDVDAEVAYTYELPVEDRYTQSGKITTDATVTNSATTTCSLASDYGIAYKLQYEKPDDVTVPNTIPQAPIDADRYYESQWVTVEDYDGTTVDDPENGGTWTFKGWSYNNKAYESGDQIQMVKGGILMVGVWKFERYPTTTLTVTKQVKGNMGSWEKEFQFTVSYGETVEKFKLAHDGSRTLTVPTNTEVTITESDNDGYTVTATVDGKSADVTDNAVTLTTTTKQNGHTVVFTNEKEATIDTGVVLDSLPYLVILAVVVVAAVVVLLRKRRMMDEE